MSKKVNATTETFERVTLYLGKNKTALFTPSRVDRNTVPNGWYCYDIRHDDSGDPYSLENYVLVNHWGSLISKDPIDITDGGLDVQKILWFDPTDDQVYFTLEEFSKYLGENKTATDDSRKMKSEFYFTESVTITKEKKRYIPEVEPEEEQMKEETK